MEKNHKLIAMTNPWPKFALEFYFRMQYFYNNNIQLDEADRFNDESNSPELRNRMLKLFGNIFIKRTGYLLNDITYHFVPFGMLDKIIEQHPSDDIEWWPSHFESKEACNEWFEAKRVH